MTHPRSPAATLHAVLLDIDGTLIDSNDAHARAWVAALAEHGYVVQYEQVRPLIGMGGDKILPMLTGLDADSGEAQRISASRSEIFVRDELPSLPATPGARALLERMRAAGLELVVATSAKKDEVALILRQAGVADLIATGSSADDADRSKPDPDIVRAALHKARRQALHSTMLGDTPYDVEAANRARVPAVALRCGGWTDDQLRGALAIYDHPADLLAHYDESPFGRGARGDG